MKIHEYQGKELLRQFGVPVPRGYPAFTVQEAVEAAQKLGGNVWVVKAQIHAGGRGKGQVIGSTQRGVELGYTGDDIAAGRGPSGTDGNCPLTEAGRTVVKHGVTLVGETNLPALVAADSSSLYARNVLDFLKLVLDKEAAFRLDLEDDIVAACLMAHGGEVTRK